MKYFLLILFVSIIVFSTCKKENAGPQEKYTEFNVFDSLDKNGPSAQQYINNIYADMPTGFNRIDGDFLNAATDDAVPSRYGANVLLLSNGNLSIGYNPDAAWAKNYASIRKVNLFLSKVDVVPKPDEVKYWKAEA